MSTLYININGDDIESTENMTVVGKPENAIINRFYFELVRGIVNGVTVPGIGEVRNRSLVTDFKNINEDAFAEITEQRDLVKQALLGQDPTGERKITLPTEYVEWLSYHRNRIYNEIAKSLANRGNAVVINIGNIYRNGLNLLVNNIDKDKEYECFVVSDTLVDDESAIAKAIRKRIGEDVPLVPFDEFRPLNDEGGNEVEEVEEETATEDGKDVVFEVGNVRFVMKHVEGGSFLMGAQSKDYQEANYDPDADDDEGPVHEVTLSDYYIGETQVTQALWKAVMDDDNPSDFKGDDNLPVDSVSWIDCTKNFITKLNQKVRRQLPQGSRFRLPTEAEWEYAARGGRLSEGYPYSGSDDIDEVAWYDENSDNETHPVKDKGKNELGLYDMSGNVWEWCNDWYGDYGSGSQTNPKGPSSGSYRVLRGGSWSRNAGNCRVSYRNGYDPGSWDSILGFRLCLPQ